MGIMNMRNIRMLWLAPLALVVSISASLGAVWAVSLLADFSFDPSVVAVLSAAVCSAGLVLRREGHNTKEQKDMG